ncbi:hypothetical protein NA57DRAFT_79062 [Rhizodiscina lignyota]|uniref:CHY-type domain-containing protein n=1 Tax=Rhizodiscina lignyota TaxID=1504668 RepID=A0A9P4M332_9PEZI|nr:hypothetical protein NA57DRAFT_79062 [Rhizodiscina lignyota]
MCKHILNAQVAIFSPCCRKFFDCPDCHRETQDHAIQRSSDINLLCKKCKRAFRKDAQDEDWDEADEHCPYCDNHYVLEALTPKPSLQVEGEDVRIDSRMLKDDRVRRDEERSIFNVKDDGDRLG